MKLPALTPRDRRALRLGALLLLPALGYGVLVRPYAAGRAALVSEVERERGLLGRERSLLIVRDEIRSQGHEASTKVRALSPLLFTGRDPTAQSGALATHVRSVASRAGVRVGDLRVPVADSTANGLQLLFVEFRGTGDLEGIATMLRELETGTRLIAVRRVVLARATGPGRRQEDVEAIDVALLVQGFASPAEGATAALLAAATLQAGTP